MGGCCGVDEFSFNSNYRRTESKTTSSQSQPHTIVVDSAGNYCTEDDLSSSNDCPPLLPLTDHPKVLNRSFKAKRSIPATTVQSDNNYDKNYEPKGNKQQQYQVQQMQQITEEYQQQSTSLPYTSSRRYKTANTENQLRKSGEKSIYNLRF